MKKTFLCAVAFIASLAFSNLYAVEYYEATVKLRPTKPYAPEGAIDALFTIDANGTQVYFSKGNLMCQGSTGIYKFHDYQYECFRQEGNNVANTNDRKGSSAWFDLFAWGTGDDGCRVWGDADNYTTFVDWGVYAIQNGGNVANKWFTMSEDQWSYVMRFESNQKRPNPSFTNQVAVNGQSGCVVYPDNWTESTCGTSLTKSEWAALEAKGAVFLPYSGYVESYYSHQFDGGFYWSTRNTRFGNTMCVKQGTTQMWDMWPQYAAAVRLVQLAQIPASIVSGTLFSSVSNCAQGKIVVTDNGNQTYTLTPVAENGYVFKQWGDNSTDATKTVVGASTAVEVTYTAQFVAGYKVTFVDGISDNEEVLVEGGQSIATQPNRSKGADYEFLGWTTTQGDASTLVTFPYTPSASVTLYALFNRTKVTVTSAIATSALADVTAANAGSLDVTIANNGKLTVSETSDAAKLVFKSIKIEAGGKLIIPADTYVGAATMVMEGGAENAGSYQFLYPQLYAAGTLNVTNGIINYDYLLNKAQQYPLCLPANVALSAITYADGTTATYGTSFKVAAYNGSERAKGNSGWYTLGGDATLTAGVGYTVFAAPQAENIFSRLRFPLNVGTSYTEAVKNIAVSAYEASKANDAGWNLVGNPYFANYSNVGGLDGNNGIGLLSYNSTLEEYDWEGTVRYVVIPADNGRNYTSVQATEANISAFKNFFVQIGAGDAITMALANRQSAAPYRKVAVENNDEIMTGIILSQTAGEKSIDKLGLLIADDYTEKYEINADLQKFGHNAGVNVYAYMDNSELAYAAVNSAIATSAIPVGYIAPATGTYTFSMDEQYANTDVDAIMLYDSETRISTNLMAENYSFTTKAGMNNKRFTLTVSGRGIASSVEQVAEQGIDGAKFIQNGQLFIKQGNLIFDAQGASVK